jgi:hypothetical protein
VIPLYILASSIELLKKDYWLHFCINLEKGLNELLGKINAEGK